MVGSVDPAPLRADMVIEYPFTRTTGSVLGAFMTGLRDGKIVGSRRADGRVFVPTAEVDPETGDAITDIVEVSSAGVVETWTWVDPPRPGSPWKAPHGLALIRLDGADTPMLHGVLVDSVAEMSTGMRVEAIWRDERVGHITDLVGFAPEGADANVGLAPRENASAEGGAVAEEPVRSIRTPIRLEYDFIPSAAAQEYLRAYADKRILGNRSPVDGAVFVPPRGVDPRHGVEATEMVDLAHTGHVGNFCVTHLPIPGRNDLPTPYASAWIHLDGADIGFLGLVSGCDLDEVRIGMRVRAVWKSDDELEATAENVRYWEPTGEPDVPVEQAGNQAWSAKGFPNA